jgi:hypothetical protein
LHTAVCVGLLLELAPAWAAAPQSAHPRIWVTAGDLPRLRAVAADARRNALGFAPADGWKAIKAQADAFVAAPVYSYAVEMPGAEGGPSKHWEYTLSPQRPPRHDDFPHYPPWTAMFQERADAITTRIQYLTFAWLISQQPAYLAKAKEIILDLCAWDGMWTDASYGGGQPCLDTGHAATWVGVFYDWAYGVLSEAERATIRGALAEKALAPIHASLDRYEAYHNGTTVLACGLCIGGLALMGEDDRAQGWADHAVRRMLLNFDGQGKDGGPMEGPMYGTYAADQIADTIWALDTAGAANPLRGHPYLKTLPRYCVTLSNPSNMQMPCFGDGDPSCGALARLMLYLALAGSSDAAWYCQEAGLLSPDSVRSFIILDPGRLRPRRPSYDPSGCFVDVGYAILRNGYRPRSAFLALKCGPPDAVIGHNHFDQNSFVINYDGAWVASDPGYRSYFDPPQRRYSTSTLGHSSVVLDLDAAYLGAAGHPDSVAGHDQVRISGGRIREFCAGRAFDYVLGDAAAAYNPADRRVLDRFDRQIVFAKPGVYFIRDSLAAPAEHTYSFLLHMGPGGECRVAGRDAVISDGGAALQAGIYSPAGIELRTASYPGAESRGPYLAATTGRAAATTITSVLVPRHRAELIVNGGFEQGLVGWTPRNAPEDIAHHVVDTEVRHGGAASGRIDGSGYYYTRHFSLPPGARVTVRFWARCAAPSGASSVLYYWRRGVAFAQTAGPAPSGDEWRWYEFSGTVPAGAEEVCLALNFFGDGRCWFDDVEVTADRQPEGSAPARVRPLGHGGADGAAVEVDGVVYVFLCGRAGEARTVAAAGHRIETDAELAAVTLGADEPRAWLLRGSRIVVDGRRVRPEGGEWRVGPR